jgi:AcrR family transcriptional regulator
MRGVGTSSRIRARPRLSRARIVAVATGIARSEGIAAASMRRIAEELDSSPMALYRHVADREQLLLAMLDEVALGVVLPDPVLDPRRELTTILSAVHDAFRRDPWVVQVLVVDGLASPLILPLVERTFAALERGGLSGRDVASAYALLFHYLYGESVATHHDRTDTVGRQMVRGAGPDFPAIARVAAALPPDERRDVFAENLQRLLDGLLPPH